LVALRFSTAGDTSSTASFSATFIFTVPLISSHCTMPCLWYILVVKRHWRLYDLVFELFISF
jgi:hypothetical protein